MKQLSRVHRALCQARSVQRLVFTGYVLLTHLHSFGPEFPDSTVCPKSNLCSCTFLCTWAFLWFLTKRKNRWILDSVLTVVSVLSAESRLLEAVVKCFLFLYFSPHSSPVPVTPELAFFPFLFSGSSEYEKEPSV